MQTLITRLDVIAVGAPSADYGRPIADLQQRIGRYVPITVHELKGTPLREGEARVVETESARIEAALTKLDTPGNPVSVVVCDRRGRPLDSMQFAQRVIGGMPRCVVIIGGACGLSDALRKRADLVLAFGALTLPHQLARLVLTEQVYRAFRIARGEPYHH